LSSVSAGLAAVVAIDRTEFGVTSMRSPPNPMKMAPKLYACVLSGALTALGISAKAQSAREVAKKSFPSVLLLAMRDERGQPVSLGSGFFVKEDVIASNVHVVEGAAKGYAKRLGENRRYAIMGIVATDLEHDLVLLAVESISGVPLKLADSSKVEVGDPVFAIGNPHGLEGTFSQGIVSAVRDIDGQKLLQLTAPISPGSSGGPVLDVQGSVVGVAVATMKSGQNLNFAVPSQYLRNLLQKFGKPIPLAAQPTKGHRGSAIDKFGGKLAEGVTAKNLRLTGTRIFGSPPTSEFTFSIVNELDIPVKSISCVVIFYDSDGSPIDFQEFQYPGVIPPSLAKRLTGSAETSIFSGKIQYGFRVINFELAD